MSFWPFSHKSVELLQGAHAKSGQGWSHYCEEMWKKKLSEKIIS